MDFDNNTPIYLQIINLIKKDIILNKLKMGEKLPSTRDMAKDLKVNPNTIARVYKELEMENITFTKRGMGTFVTEDIEIVKEIKKSMAQGLMKSFVDGMTDLGFEKDDIIEMIKDL